MNYTDDQLKQALAKMFPEKSFKLQKSRSDTSFAGLSWSGGREVLDTELLHLCWLVEETLEECDDPTDISEWSRYYNYLGNEINNIIHASWQQRTIALAKVKGIEII